MPRINPLFMMDGYKVDHRRQYPDKTEFVYSNWTPRKSRLPNFSEVVFFGLQYFIKEYLIDRFDNDFFFIKKDVIVKEFEQTMLDYLGPNNIGVQHIMDLHDLGYLPLKIKALPEGTLCPIRVPMLTMVNTLPDFFWLTNQLETIMSCTLWQACTSATLAKRYRDVFDQYNLLTGISKEFGRYQGHDFSFRGMSSLETSCISGAAHLLSFSGTDTIPAIPFIKQYYNGTGKEGCSVPASEHSVASSNILLIQKLMNAVDSSSPNCNKDYMLEAEIASLHRLLTEVYPTGVFSYVSDTFDFWRVLTEVLPRLKDVILARDGTLVIRPDSSDPVDCICGDTSAPVGSPEYKGAFEILYELFGGTTNSKGYIELNPKVGLIYGDSITLSRQETILKYLTVKGFAPTVILGIGSYSYQYVTRDTFGFAMKATNCIVNGESIAIYKDPKTDTSKEKKSAKGLIHVIKGYNNQLSMLDNVKPELEAVGELKTVFEDADLVVDETFENIRKRLNPQF